MNKQIIEEMAKVIESVKLYGNDNYERKISRDSVVELAEELLKYYQPKIPENAVVLTQDEVYEFRKDQAGVKFLKKQIQEQARKETAEKFALKLADYFVGNCGGRLFVSLTLQEWYKMIDEIAKEFTEGKV